MVVKLAKSDSFTNILRADFLPKNYKFLNREESCKKILSDKKAVHQMLVKLDLQVIAINMTKP